MGAVGTASARGMAFFSGFQLGYEGFQGEVLHESITVVIGKPFQVRIPVAIFHQPQKQFRMRGMVDLEMYPAVFEHSVG